MSGDEVVTIRPTILQEVVPEEDRFGVATLPTGFGDTQALVVFVDKDDAERYRETFGSYAGFEAAAVSHTRLRAILDAHALDAVVLAEPWYDAPGSDWSLSLFPAGAFLDLLTEEAA